jgi:hypothetical protein
LTCWRKGKDPKAAVASPADPGRQREELPSPRGSLRRALLRAHPLAYLALLAVALFSLQPFRYHPAMMAQLFVHAAALPGLGLGLACAALAALWAMLRGEIKPGAKRDSGFFRGRLSASVLATRLYWSDWIWTLAVTSLIMTLHFLVKISIHAINPRLFDAVLATYDRGLGLGHDPVALLLSLLEPFPWILRFLDFAYGFAYFATVVISGPALAFLVPARKDRLAFAAAFNLLWIVGAVFYVAFPSWGPAFSNHDAFAAAQAHMPVTRWGQGELAKELWGLLSDPYGQRPYGFGGVAAFPSLHIAVITLLTLCSWRAWKSWGLVNAGIAVVLFIGSMVTGYHYLFDSLAGIVIAAAALLLADRWVSACLRAQGEGGS